MDVTPGQMLELIAAHFRTALSDPDPARWDWSLPLHLIQGAPGWTPARLERLVDRYHNGPTWAR